MNDINNKTVSRKHEEAIELFGFIFCLFTDFMLIYDCYFLSFFTSVKVSFEVFCRVHGKKIYLKIWLFVCIQYYSKGSFPSPAHYRVNFCTNLYRITRINVKGRRHHWLVDILSMGLMVYFFLLLWELLSLTFERQTNIRLRRSISSKFQSLENSLPQLTKTWTDHWLKRSSE